MPREVEREVDARAATRPVAELQRFTPPSEVRALLPKICEAYGLSEHPFNLNPNPRFFYPSAQHRSSVSKVQYILEGEGGLAIIVGDVGTGKTISARFMFSTYVDEPEYRVVMIYNPHFSTRLQFLQAICDEFKIERIRNEARQMRLLEDHLAREMEDGRTTILFIDEAQLLGGPHLELVRQLLNFEGSTRKTIQIVLFGQSDSLIAKLRSKPALLSRVATESVLQRFDLVELEHMIRFRERVTGRLHPLFTEAGYQALYEHSKGVPRDAVELCAHALPIGFTTGKDPIDDEVVHQAFKDARSARTSF